MTSRILSIFFLINFLLSCQSQNEDIITNLSYETFQTQVQDSNDVWFVEFFSDSQSEYIDKLAPKLSLYGIKTGVINCSDKLNKKICLAVSTSIFRLYTAIPKLNPYTNKLYRDAHTYEGQPETRSLEKFITKPFSDIVSKLTSEDQLVNMNDSAILFSEKDSVSMHYKSAAFSCKAKSPELNFYQVSTSVDSITDKYGITSFPSFIISFKNGTVSKFQGDIQDRPSLVEWCVSTSVSVGKTESAAEPDLNDNGKMIQRISKFINKLSKNVFVATAPNFAKEVINNPVYAWVVSVFEVSANSSNIEDNERVNSVVQGLSRKCNGALQAAVLFCSTTGNYSHLPASLEEMDPDDLGYGLCKRFETDRAANRTALGDSYIFVVPHGETSRKKKSFSKWIYALDSWEEAVRVAGESLPEDAVASLNELTIDSFIKRGAEREVLSVILLSDRDRDSGPPAVLRNLALIIGQSQGQQHLAELEIEAELGFGFAQVGIVTKPSKQFLQSFGPQLKLPALIGFFPAAKVPGDDGRNMQMVVYNSEHFGPISLQSAKDFAFQALANSQLKIPPRNTVGSTADEVPVGTVKADEKKGFTEQAELPPSDPLSAEDEEMLEEIRREEAERAALRAKEVEEERRRLEEERIQREKELAAAKKKKNKKKKTTPSDSADSKKAEL